MTTKLVIALFGSNGVFWYYITNAQRKRQAIKIIMFSCLIVLNVSHVSHFGGLGYHCKSRLWTRLNSVSVRYCVRISLM